jgi:putative hydrolase
VARRAARNPAHRDLNATIAALLRDMAAAQSSVQSRWGYTRAASAVLHLDRPLDELLSPDGSLPKIPYVGPSSLRIVHEVLATGRSATVERALSERPRADRAGADQDLRAHFLSVSEVVRALRNPRLTGPQLSAYRGDLQMHSVWSDGADSLETLIEACLKRGYAYCAITDHSYGLPVARGVPMEKLARQHREIDGLNRRYRGRFRMLKGIECNIGPDGHPDMSAAELATLEIVVASPHSALRSTADQTRRMLTAVSTRGVHILGHPRGRKYDTRPGVSADWDRIFRKAARTGVAIEIDGDPSRQDVDFTLAARAVDAGCLIAVDSDAHATAELSYAEIGLAHARLAGVPPDRVVNTWPLARLLEWARSRR